MKRVCTLRKVIFSVSKVLLESYFLSFLNIVAFITTQFLSFLNIVAFITTQFLSFLNIVAFYRHSVLIVFIISPAGRYAMEWKGTPKYLYEKNFFSILLPHLPHAY